MSIFSDFSRASVALERIAAALSGAVRATQENTLPLERLDELERSRTLWEAEVQGLLQKAEGKLRSSSNAEARTRVMAKKYEEFDPFGDHEELEAPVPGEVAVGYEEEAEPLRLDVAPESRKENALRYKFS